LNRNWLWLIPALILIWDVMHGAIYGIALVFLFVAGEICTSCLSSNFSMARLEKGKKQYLTTMCFVSAAVVLVAAINPYGMIGYKFFISLLAGNQMAAQVGEFTKTPFWDVYTLFWVGFAFSIVVCLWCIRNKELTVPFILIPFSILAFLYSRVTAPFAVIAFPLVAISLLEATKNIRNTRLMRYSHALPLVLLVFIFGFIFQYKIFSNSHLNSFGLGLHDRYFPAGSLRFVQDNRIDGRLYNPGRFGGYLAFNQPDKKIFLYNHHTVFGDLYSSLTNPFSVLKWDVNYAYVGDYWQSKHLFPLSEWAPVYWERANMLMLRRVESNREIIAEHEIQYFTPFRGVEKLRELAGDRNIYPKLMKELTTYLRYRGDANIAREYSNMMRLDNPGLPIATKLRLVGDAMLSNSLELKPLWESLSAGSNQKE